MIKALRRKLSLYLPSFSSLSFSEVKKEMLHTLGSISLVWQILFFYLPLGLLFFSSFATTNNLDHSFSFSLSHFTPLFHSAYYKIIASSILLSFLTALLSLAIAFPLTYYIVFKTKKWKYLLLFFLIIPFWTNFLLHIYAWFFLLEKNGLINHFLISAGLCKTPLTFLHTKYATLALMVYYYLPFAALPIFSALERFNISYIEASLTLGASKVKTFIKVVFPLISKALISGFFLVFIPAFGEFLIPEFVGGDKTFYVGNVISLYLIGEKSAKTGLAFTTLSVLFLMATSFLIYFLFTFLFKKMKGAS